MNKYRIRSIIDRLKKDLSELESELTSDVSAYLGKDYEVDYEEILTYYQTNDDDEEGL